MILDYIKIARPDHWFKHIFIIPGIVLAYILIDNAYLSVYKILMGFISACFLASANYVINEWYDADFDKFHPIKKERPAVMGRLKKGFVLMEYFILISLGLLAASHVSNNFFYTAVFFIFMALLYNLKPFRLKDRVVLDVLSESINNPIRLMFGWSMVSSTLLPPSSLYISFWFGGAFLMAAKRLAEYRFIVAENGLANLENYRRSFKYYTENSLLVSSFLYGLLCSFFIAAFFIKHRNEFLFTFPAFAALFAYYLSVALRKWSIAQMPEKLHKDAGLMMIVFILVMLLIIFSFVDVPLAERLIGIQKGLNYSIWE